jgi:hypothetical protein
MSQQPPSWQPYAQQVPTSQWAPPGAVPPQVGPLAPSPRTPVARKRRKWPWIFGAVVLLLFAAVVAGVSGSKAAPGAGTGTPACMSAAGCVTVPNMIGSSKISAAGQLDAAGFTGGREQFAQVPDDAVVSS